MKNNITEMELSLIGLILIKGDAFEKADGLLTKEDFSDKKSGILFNIFEILHEESTIIELSTVLTTLKKLGLTSFVNEHDLADFIAQAGIEENLMKYVREISDQSKYRKITKSVKSLSNSLEQGNINLDQAISITENEITSLNNDHVVREIKSAKDVAEKSLRNLEIRAAGDSLSGISSEYPSLDEYTSGFQKGDLIIVAGRPSMGKTAFALNIATNVAKFKNVALFSLEMASEQLMNRIMSSTSFISGKKMREPHRLTPDEWKKIQLRTEQMKNLRLWIDDSAGVTLSDIIWKCKKLKKNKGLDLIVIDYLQLITVGRTANDNRQLEVTQISRRLKQLARELEVPVIALSQLSRRVENRESKVPLMSDLRESGAIEQDADLIAFLYRESYYDKEKATSMYHETDIIIAKHRNGPTGDVKLTFRPDIGLFTDLKGGKK